MRTLLVLGGGTAGTMTANRLRHRLDSHDWRIVVVDQNDEHHYQPGYLFIPFGMRTRDQVVRSRHHFLARRHRARARRDRPRRRRGEDGRPSSTAASWPTTTW